MRQISDFIISGRSWQFITREIGSEDAYFITVCSLSCGLLLRLSSDKLPTIFKIFLMLGHFEIIDTLHDHMNLLEVFGGAKLEFLLFRKIKGLVCNFYFPD